MGSVFFREQRSQEKMKINLPKLKEKPENFYDAGYNDGI